MAHFVAELNDMMYTVVRKNCHLFTSFWFLQTLTDLYNIWHIVYRVVHQPVSRIFAVFADVWLSGWLAEISADLRETVAH